MKLQHYLGGLEGLELPPSLETRVFVQPWEKVIFAIHVAMMGLSRHLAFEGVNTSFRHEWTWADLRKGAEAMNPFDYFRFRYYEKWLGGISGFFVETGYISDKELESRTSAYLANPEYPERAGGDPSVDEQIIHYLETGDSPLRVTQAEPTFSVGDKVSVKDVPSADHTRLPGHLRGKHGTIHAVYPGTYTYFCSTGKDGLGVPMPSYCVKFAPADIWDESNVEPGCYFYADLFEAYLTG